MAAEGVTHLGRRSQVADCRSCPQANCHDEARAMSTIYKLAFGAKNHASVCLTRLRTY